MPTQEVIKRTLDATIGRLFFSISEAIPEPYRLYFNLGFYLIAITLYAIFIWKFYRFLARRDLLQLNLKQYNRVEHAFFNKLLALLLFTLEYIIVVPIVVFFWFIIMAALLLLLAKELTMGNILLVSACIVGAVRMTAYYSQDLSKDLAKMFPFTILAIALVTPGFFNPDQIVERFSQIGGVLDHIFVYLLAIIAIEFFLRMLFLIMPEKPAEELEKEKEKA